MDVCRALARTKQARAMDSDLDYSSIDFRGLSQKEQIAKCRAMAREAEGFASSANDEKHAEYSDLAMRWSTLADEMECATSRQDMKEAR